MSKLTDEQLRDVEREIAELVLLAVRAGVAQARELRDQDSAVALRIIAHGAKANSAMAAHEIMKCLRRPAPNGTGTNGGVT